MSKKQPDQTLTVYLGSSGRCRKIFKDTAKELGIMIGTHKKTLVYGGMDSGLMGIIANEALASGARVTGIIPKKLKDSERIHPDLSQTILVPDLWERKLKMFQRADIIVTLPGGFGTIDEFLEALYWANLGAHTKPIILVNTENYWDDFITFINILPDMPKGHLLIVPTIQDIFTTLEDWSTPPPPTTDQFPNFEDDILETTDTPLIFDTPTIASSYKLATALGLKQLGKHNRPIGILNKNEAFTPLLHWIERAQKEHFITDRCTKLYSVAETQQSLAEKLSHQKKIDIDLDTEKWGPSETKTHIEIKEIR